MSTMYLVHTASDNLTIKLCWLMYVLPSNYVG
jgi:hypothetical protein